MTLTAVLGTTLGLTAIIAGRYLLVAAVVHWLAWQWKEPRGPARLNRDRPSAAQIRREIGLSLLSSPIYALPAAVALEAWKHG